MGKLSNLEKKNTIESSATFENGGQLKKGSEWLFWALNNYKLLTVFKNLLYTF